MKKKNHIKEIVLKVRDEGGTPRAALALSCIWLRGGIAKFNVIAEDIDEWVDWHGRPTWPRLVRWARTKRMEADIVAPLVRRGIETAQSRSDEYIKPGSVDPQSP